MKRRNIYIIIAIAIALVGVVFILTRTCEKSDKPESIKEYAIDPASPPSELRDHQARRDYFTLHYWDNFDFQDNGIWKGNDSIINSGFASYVVNFKLVEPTVVRESIEGVLDDASVDQSGRMLVEFSRLYEEFLYEPESPFRDDEYYIMVLEKLLSMDSDGIEQDSLRAVYEHAMLNRIGTRANNISYTSIHDKKGSLYGTNTKYTLILFYYPDLLFSEVALTELKQSSLLNRLLDMKRMTVLAFYPEDDMDAWRKYADKIPETWINAADPSGEFKNSNLYHLRTTPGIYLVDKNKNIILKDATLGQIKDWLMRCV